jgi:hypothetical protein
MSIWPYRIGHHMRVPYTLVTVPAEMTPRLLWESVELVERNCGMTIVHAYADRLRPHTARQARDDFL